MHNIEQPTSTTCQEMHKIHDKEEIQIMLHKHVRKINFQRQLIYQLMYKIHDIKVIEIYWRKLKKNPKTCKKM